jgi:Putative abortive phage resistance protein AbiGi, antitoxin
MVFQRYVSPDLTHFVGRALKNDELRYQLLKRILVAGLLKARPKARSARYAYVLEKHTDLDLSSNDAYRGSVVCFCDIPPSDLWLHMGKYSRFGLSFPKAFVAECGALPVMYVPIKGRPSLLPSDDYPYRSVASQKVAFDQFSKWLSHVEAAIKPLSRSAESEQVANDLRRVIDFLEINILSHLKFFDHGLHDADPDNFYMEREWRVSQNVAFGLSDVQRVIIPASFSRRFRKTFPDYDGELVFAE